MNAFTEGLKYTKDGLGKGLQNITSSVEHSFKSDARDVQEARDAEAPGPGLNVLPESLKDGFGKSLHSVGLHSTTGSKPEASQRSAQADAQQAQGAPASNDVLATSPPPPPSLFTSLLSTPSAVASLALSTTRAATTSGLAIGTSIARSGLDASTSVVSLTTTTASLAGTALGGVVAAAAESSGTVFEPVGAGLKTLKALEGFEALEHGIDTINGLSLGAVRKVSELTTKALNMSGKTPTFFDPDADGIVRVSDTIRGLVLLGLDQKNATYAAYALHAVFSYSTSDRWIPALDKSLPIRVARLERTRWGKNWGTFERLEWVDDVEIDKFFITQKSEKFLSDYYKQGRQGFGMLLLIFEWGTTWPFYMPPLSVPVDTIPFANDIGTVVRKAILPTIISNFKKARAVNPQAQQACWDKVKAPEEPINMPGEYTE